ncbi:MAG: uroporphyrinogen decarboxylase family protein [Christensenellales bacterium]|jgi:hypothetical protein
MKSRDRVACSVSHREPDRVPVDFGGMGCSTMHASCIAALREHYGLEKRPVKVLDPFMMIGLIEEDLQDALKVDTTGVGSPYTVFGYRNEDWKPWQLPDGTDVLVGGGFAVTGDGKGGLYIHPKGDVTAPPSGHMPQDGFYFDLLSRQMEYEDDEFELADNLTEFTPYSKHLYHHYRQTAKAARETGRYVIAGFEGTALGDIVRVVEPWEAYPKGLRDMEEWLISISLRPDYIKSIFDYQVNMAIENLGRLDRETVESIDAIMICGTDFGMQTGLFYSLNSIKDVFMPYYKKLNAWIHQNLGWKTIKHSCGSNEPIIPLLIEAEFDCLNPVQCSAAGMDAAELKRKYGRDIVFWGGGVDTQQMLPFGTPEQVRAQVLERMEIFSKGGGFVFNAIHNVQPGSPVENLVAMFDAIAEFNGIR